MKIQFLTSVAGERFAYRAKQVVDLRVDLAKGFIKAGQAVEVRAPESAPAPLPAQVETATVAASENAAAGRRGKRKGFGGLIRGE